MLALDAPPIRKLEGLLTEQKDESLSKKKILRKRRGGGKVVLRIFPKPREGGRYNRL